MSELIKINDRNGKSVVSARELHSFLEATERFSNWFERQLQYGFEENIDYVGCKVFNTLANQELDDYAIVLDMAKELSMLSRSEKGKQARKYFIDCEKKVLTKKIDFSDPDNILQLAQSYKKEREKVLLLESKIEEDKPKVVFAESVIGSSNSILVRQFAKDLCDGGFEIGQNRLFEWFRDNKYLNKDNEPYQNHVASGLFEVITRTIGSGSETFTTRTTKITGKGQVYFANKIKNQ